MGGEKPVSLIGSLVCQTFCGLTMVMWNANAVNEVKYENLLERCVRRPEELRMYVAEERMKVVLVRRLVEQMVSWTQLRQGNVFSERRILLQVEIRVRHREVERVLLQRRDECTQRSEERD